MAKTESTTIERSEKKLAVGDRLVVSVTNNDTGKTVFQEEHEVVAKAKTAAAPDALHTGLPEEDLDTRVVSSQWFDPELEALNAPPKVEAPMAASPVDVAKVAVEAGKLGLGIAKFSWDVIKDNKAVVDVTSTTSSVLGEKTKALDYAGARRGETSSYTISVRDSIVRPWELIHAEIKCEGTYRAAPSKAGIPDGYYMPAINVFAPKAKADFPCQLSAKAQLSDVTNMGRSGQKLDPMVTILADLNFGWLLQRRHLTLKFTAQGSQGFSMTT